MNKVSGASQAIDFLSANMRQKIGEDATQSGDFQSILNAALSGRPATGQQQGKETTFGAEQGAAEMTVESARPVSRPVSADRPSTGESKQATNAGDTAPTEGKVSVAIEEGYVKVDAPVLPIAPAPEIIEVPVLEADDGEIAIAPPIAELPPAIAPPTISAESAPIIQIQTNQVQYARQIAELLQANQAQKPVEVKVENLLSMVESTQVTVTGSPEDGILGAANLNKFVNSEEAQAKLTELMEKAEKELAEYGTDKPVREVLKHLKAVIPDEVPEHRGISEPLKTVMQNMVDAPRGETDSIIEVRAEREEVVPALVQTTQPQRIETAPPAPVASTPTPQTYVAQTVEQVHAQILHNLDLKNMHFQMQLNPNELGPLRISMIMSNGVVTSMEIIASSTRTADMLTRGIESLVNSLRLSGIEAQNITVTQTEAQSNHLNHDRGAQEEAYKNGGNNKGGSGNGKDADGDEQEEQNDRVPEKLLDYAV